MDRTWERSLNTTLRDHSTGNTSRLILKSSVLWECWEAIGLSVVRIRDCRCRRPSTAVVVNICFRCFSVATKRYIDTLRWLSVACVRLMYFLLCYLALLCDSRFMLAIAVYHFVESFSSFFLLVFFISGDFLLFLVFFITILHINWISFCCIYFFLFLYISDLFLVCVRVLWSSHRSRLETNERILCEEYQATYAHNCVVVASVRSKNTHKWITHFWLFHAHLYMRDGYTKPIKLLNLHKKNEPQTFDRRQTATTAVTVTRSTTQMEIHSQQYAHTLNEIMLSFVRSKYTGFFSIGLL